jgi:hypothetical protein
MSDNDTDLSAWGMRYALIPVLASFHAVITSILTLLIRAVIVKFGVFRKVSETNNLTTTSMDQKMSCALNLWIK